MKNQASSQPVFFQVNYKLLILVIITLPILLKLGFWQLDRAQQKVERSALVDKKFATTPEDFCVYLRNNSLRLGQKGGVINSHEELLKTLTASELQYQPISISGELTANYFLLDNQMHQTQVGYEVLQVMNACDISIILSRGFVRADPDRNILPDIKLLTGPHQVLSYLYTHENNRWLENDQVQKVVQWPVRIVKADSSHMQEYIQRPLFPAIARIYSPNSDAIAKWGQSNQQLALINHWHIKSSGPAMHYGYALQWFAMALIILILFIYSGVAHRIGKIKQ